MFVQLIDKVRHSFGEKLGDAQNLAIAIRSQLTVSSQSDHVETSSVGGPPRIWAATTQDHPTHGVGAQSWSCVGHYLTVIT